jgi:hypothetical protein
MESFSTILGASRQVFKFRSFELIFDGIEGADLVFKFRAPGLILAVTWASGPIFKFCAPRLVFNGTECVGSSFQGSRFQTHFRWYRGRQVQLSNFTPYSRFRQYQGHLVLFSSFEPSYSFFTVTRVSGPVFKF